MLFPCRCSPGGTLGSLCLALALTLSLASQAAAQDVAASGAADNRAAPGGDALRPNLVIILVDDLGWGDLGCYGHPQIRTPALDRLAREGTRFTQFYAAATVCTPSRAGLLTGRLAVRTGLDCGPRRVLFPDSTGGIPADEITLAEALAPLGYTSAIVGKWHLGHLPTYLPTRHGFASYFGIPYSNDMSPAHSAGGKLRGWPPTPLLRDEEQIESEPDQAQLTRRYTDESIAFIRQMAARQASDPQKRFFLYLPHTMPHVPLFAEAPFLGRSPRGLYGDVVESIDAGVARIIDTLHELHLADNTLVVFTSDNGPWIELGQRGGSAGPLREGKGSTWEGGYRVPGIAWWPGKVPMGRTATGLVSALDLFPTCLALAGGAPPKGLELDGLDQSAYLLGQGESARNEMFYYRERELFAVRQGEWKIHFRTQKGYGQPRPQVHDPPLLFNLHADPGEQTDRSAEQPELVSQLRQLADQHRQAVTLAPPQM